MGRLTGKIALVTGAGSPIGIGYGIAQALCREGASVAMTDIESEGVEEGATQLAGDGAKVLGLQHDVTLEDSWKDVLAESAAKLGRIDILVNNAGITLRHNVEDMPLEDWERVLAVNLTGSFLGCKHAIAAMRQDQRGGSIINIASIAGLRGFRKSVAYGASKGGLRQISKVVAIEGAGAQIRCNTIFPGMINSEIHRAIIADAPDQHRAVVDAIPMGRMGEPSDIAECVVYLASDEARYVTGAEIVIDGGSTSR